MRRRRGDPARRLSCSAVVRILVACVLVVDRSLEVRAAAEPSLGSDRRDATLAGLAAERQEVVFEDLPEGFHGDVDSITVAVGGHHTCALEYRPGVDFGGPVRCWGRDDWGQSMPSDDIFVQVRSGCLDQTVAYTAIPGNLTYIGVSLNYIAWSMGASPYVFHCCL